MVIMALDYGKARTGVALCDKNETLSYPFVVIHESKYLALVNKIIDIVHDKNVEKIILGDPKNMDNSLSYRSKEVRRLASILKRKLKLPVILLDERLTSVSADKMLSDLNYSLEKKKNVIDSVAATIILDMFLNSSKQREV